MRPVNISFHPTKKSIQFPCVFLAASVLIFFITGFIFYTPPKIELAYDSMKIHMKRIPDVVSPLIEGKEKEGGGKGSERFSSAVGGLPRLDERLGKVRVATRYEGLLAQMDSILEDIGSAQESEVVKNRGEERIIRDEDDPTDEGISAGSSLEAIIRERMVMIGDVLEYASSQAGITVDLLAAVAWAESKMLPYAINVKGKAYYFTSREQALKALRGLDTGDVDIGLFQVNYRVWGEPLGLNKEDLLDSRVCAVMGAMILKYNLQRHKDPWEAIGRYHSGDMSRMREYQTKVSRGLTIIRALFLTLREREGSQFYGMAREDTRDPAFHNAGCLDS